MHNRMMITGAGSGLGREIALRWARDGWQLALSDVNEAGLAETLKMVREAGGDGFTMRCDVRDYSQLIAFAQACEEKLGGIDVVVNNAGVASGGFFDELSLEDWDWQIAINLMGVVKGCKAFLPLVQKSKGKIINIASVQSELARPGIAPYTATKGAVRNLTRGMATDWAKYGLQVNAIAPGYFKTPLNQALVDSAEFSTWLEKRTPAARWGTVDELVGAAVFLAGDASSFVNGHTLYVDGGITASL